LVDKIDMNEIKESDDKKQEGLSRPRKLELKKTVESGQVRQSFAHGRSKMVTVEVRKKRTYAPDDRGKMAEIRHEAEQAGDLFVESAALSAQADGLPREGAAIGLTNQEKAARARALQDAKKVEEERQHLPPELEIVVEPEFPSADESESVEEEAPAQEAEQVTEEGEPESAKADRSDAEPAEGRESEKSAGETADAVAGKPKAVESEDEETRKGGRSKRPLRAEVRRPAGPGRRSEPPRRGSKLSLVDALNESGERVRSLASVKRAREKEKLKQQQMRAETVKVFRDVVIPESLTVQELANRMAERSTDVIKALMKMGVMANINNVIDGDTAEVVVNEFGHKSKRVSDADVEIGLKGEDDDQQNLQVRPPVVTVMGHVDHGKTSLLDALRKTDVAAREAGGITQHIGAYQVTMPHGGKITFVDTPGHAAFTQMRARGAHVTDIVVLVVAADDGVMPQTIEAIDHAKAANVPLIIAVNKIDRPDSNPERVRTELLQHGIVVESMSGETLCVEVSAKEGTNLDKLEEAILLQAELLDLTANPDRPAEGVIVEAKMERGRGTVATVLVQRGTLRVGEIFVAGGEWGRVRGLSDSLGNPLDEAGPGMPVEVLGLTGTPAAGDDVVVVESEARAREVTEFRQRRVRDAKVASNRGSLEQMFDRIQAGGAKELPVLIKADVHGSVEAIAGALDKLGTDEVKVQVLHAAVGGINESDISLARASEALIVGFNVRANPQAREMAKRDGIEIRYYSIIYNLTDDLKQMLSGMLAPKRRENILGYAEIREVFNVTKVGKVAGCMTTEGVIRRGARVRLLRDNVVIHEGELSQLKRFKDDVKEVREGYDCGVALANYHDIQIGDTIECFDVEMVAREL
jgi:translation initiation factor IF-2